MFDLLERWAVRFLNWKWGREDRARQSPAPVPWTKDTVYVGFQPFQAPADTSDNEGLAPS